MAAAACMPRKLSRIAFRLYEKRMLPGSFLSRFGVSLFGVLPISLFIGVMIASAGVAVHPPIAFIATPLVCSGEVEVESQNYSYRPGQSGVTRTIWCTTSAAAGGKPAREDITLKAMGAAFIVYSAIAFVLLQLLWMMMRPRVTGLFRVPGRSAAAGEGFGGGGLGGAGVDLPSILAQVAESVKSGEAKVTVRNMAFDLRDDGGPGDAEGEDPAERLERLKRLYDQGLITAAEYQAKRSEILAGL